MAERRKKRSLRELTLSNGSTHYSLRKRILPFKSKKETTRNPNPIPSLTSCHRCKAPTTDLEALDSQWRISLLCSPCLDLVRSAEVCSYCFLHLSEEEEDFFLKCVRCFRRVHYSCIPCHRYYVSASKINPESYSCVDCCPAPMWNANIGHAVSEDPQWVINGSKRVLKSSRRSSVSSDDDRIGLDNGGKSSLICDLSVDMSYVDKEAVNNETEGYRREKQKKVVESDVFSDKWEWLKYGECNIKGFPYPRCKSFSKGCIAKKHVDRSETDPSKFVITYIAEHDHSVDVPQNLLLVPVLVDEREAQKEIEGSSLGGSRSDQQKKVVMCPVSSDKWEWQKNGSRPIKGSLYPRLYYKCKSFSDGCIARKQVEQNQTNPDMFVITYIAEHNHPILDAIAFDLSPSDQGETNNKIEGNSLELTVGSIRKRKNQQKKVVLSDVYLDKWKWLQYGTRPHKGSPYPRVYYRCKSYSEGCIAKKLVDRCQTDRNIFVISYIAEHNHSVQEFQNLSLAHDLVGEKEAKKEIQKKEIQRSSPGCARTFRASDNQTLRFRRGSQHENVMRHIPANSVVSSDKWTWRKYTEGESSGSPYRKSTKYYRGCLTKKQVEQSTRDSQLASDDHLMVVT